MLAITLTHSYGCRGREGTERPPSVRFSVMTDTKPRISESLITPPRYNSACCRQWGLKPTDDPFFRVITQDVNQTLRSSAGKAYVSDPQARWSQRYKELQKNQKI
jgi:hypothetical protein